MTALSLRISAVAAAFAELAERHALPMRSLCQEDEVKAWIAGTHRTRTPTETIALAEQVLPSAGVSRIADITGLDYLGLPVFNSIRPDAEARNLTVTCGKGLSRDTALASAMMEAVERDSGEQRGRDGVVGTLSEVAELTTPLHPSRLVLARNHEWAKDVPLEWWPTWNLVTDQLVLVPAAAVFTPYKKPPRLIGGCSDGLAAGNSRAEAVLHALYELIERDCTAFGETLLDGMRVDLPSLTGHLADLRDRLHRFGIQLHLFVFINDIGVPTFYALIDDAASAVPWLICAGAGCHLDPEVAAARAITEAIQSRLSVISGGREDLARLTAQRHGSYQEVRDLLTPWLRMPEQCRLADFPNLSRGTLREDLALLLASVHIASGGAALATEITRFPMPFSVVRVIVPGLEFFHEERNRMGKRLFTKLMSKRSTVGG